MSQSQRLQPGHLLTTQERRILRDIALDLERQIDRAPTRARITQLEALLENVRREQQTDRAIRRSLPRKQGKGKR